MNITKSQSKQLRYMCGVVDYNQPCTRKYTGTPEGKLREIGRFKYLENGGELKSFTFDGGTANLDGISFDVLLSGVMEGDLRVPLQVAALPEPGKPSDIEDAVAPAEPPIDDWCTPENVSDWHEPDETAILKKNAIPVVTEPTAEGYVEPDLPEDIFPKAKRATEEDNTLLDAPKVEHPPITRDEFENAIRETAMNAAAREALHLCNIECGPECYVAATIIRANATVPHFLDTYSKCLEHVGIPHSLEEIATALPNQETWLRSLAINNWKIKD